MSNQGNITYQKLWNTAKTTLRGEFMAIGAYIRKSKGLKINEWSMVYGLCIQFEHNGGHKSASSELMVAAELGLWP